MLYANVCLLLVKPVNRALRLEMFQKVIDVFQKNLFMSIRLMKKENRNTTLLKIKVLHDAIVDTFCLNGSIKNFNI